LEGPPARRSHRPLARKASGAAGDWETKLCTAGSRRKLPPPWGGAGRRRRGGPIPLRLRRGAGSERGCAYEQSRNVLSFHGHYARDSTFYQGFRLRTGGGGSGSRSGCNDLATGSREAGAGGVRQGEDLLGTPPRGSGREQLLAPAALPLPPAQPLGAYPISPGRQLSPHFAYQQRKGRSRKSRKTPSPGLYLPLERVRPRRCLLSV